MYASFKAVRPFCFIVPLNITGNSGAPLGLIVPPAEKVQSYSIFYDALVQEDASLTPLLDSPLILSDLGSGRVVSAGARSKHHFLCYQNMLERLDSWSVIATFARQLLFTGSRAKDFTARAEVGEDLNGAI
jgi:hypothetical protein